MLKPSVYACGQITGKTFAEANQWRRLLAKMLEPEVEVLSPLRGKEHLIAKGMLHSGSYEDSPLTLSKGFVARDRFDVNRCDIVLANFLDATTLSIGALIELGWADAARKPIIMIPDPGGLYKHGFIDNIVPYIVPSLFDAVALIETLVLA